MDIKVYEVSSSLNEMRTHKGTEDFFFEIEGHMNHKLALVKLDDFLLSDFRLLYVATGGSEEAFVKVFDQLKDKPIYILTSGVSNSLAASMEILTFIQNNGAYGEILHGSAEKIAMRIAALHQAIRAKNALSGIRMGKIGRSSDWLISSEPNLAAYKQKLGAELVEITMQELEEEIGQKKYDSNEWTEKLLAMTFDENEVQQALYVYGALRRLTDKYHLGAVTVRCFDLLSSVKTTGCLGLAILNAQGVWAGCEGDVPSLMSMCILGAVSQKPIFMCNPSRIDADKGEMIFAHCTLPINMPYAMTLATHFESGIGVAIAGSVAEGTCTIFKASADLSRHVELLGTITENLRDPHLCRSQIKISLSDFDYFTKNPIHNHHLVCVGNEVTALQEFFHLL